VFEFFSVALWLIFFIRSVILSTGQAINSTMPQEPIGSAAMFFRRLASVIGAIALLATAGEGAQAPKAEKPDLIVASFTKDGDDLVLEIQNQGPGVSKKGATVEAVFSGTLTSKAKEKTITGKDKFISTPYSFSVMMPVPVEALATEKVKVPLAKFGVKEGGTLNPLIGVVLDPKKTLPDERPGNNSYFRQIDFAGFMVQPPRGDYRTGTELPDLVITDITQDGPYLVTHYKNQGKGSTGADFLMVMRLGKEKFEGNHYYRSWVPPPGEAVKSGGYTHNLMPGEEVEVEVSIDNEDRVRETDKKNNTFKKKISIMKKK